MTHDRGHVNDIERRRPLAFNSSNIEVLQASPSRNEEVYPQTARSHCSSTTKVAIEAHHLAPFADQHHDSVYLGRLYEYRDRNNIISSEIPQFSYNISPEQLTMASARVAGPLGQPDIGYTPDLDKYLARVNRRKENEKLETSLPPGFPSRLDSPLVWDAEEVERTYNWTYELNAEELEDIERGLRHFRCKCPVPWLSTFIDNILKHLISH